VRKVPFDFKKEYKDLYMPKSAPVLIDVPAMNFIMIDGCGDPNGIEYQNAVGTLYALSYAIKMSKMGGNQPAGYFEYVVPPLEGLWWCAGDVFDFNRRDSWLWISMIRQPEFVTGKVFTWAMETAKKKKPEFDYGKARLETFIEGLCVQMMHIGPYADEPATMAQLHGFVEQNKLKNAAGTERKHHEIYLGDPRKTAPERLKTVLRLPVEEQLIEE
jgi:hypothetical protein